jgi:folate-binding protein YgfZ
VSLKEFLKKRAASVADYDGAQVAQSYGDVALEWATIDGSAALVDTGFRRTISASGSERREFLNGQLSHSLVTIKKDHGTPALLLNVQGRVETILSVYDAGEDFKLVVEAAHVERTLKRLEQFLVADDVELEVEPPRERFTVVGPDAPRLVAGFGVDVPALDPTRAAEWFMRKARIGREEVTVFGRGDLRVPAIEIVTNGDASAAWQAFEARGARVAGSQAFEIVRVEGGTPRYGVDVDDTRVALEARLEWAIHFRKGCYVGQEIIERAVSRGRVNRLLALLQTGEPAKAGDLVQATGEKEHVTSVVTSPRLGPICLAYALREHAEPGKKLVLERAQQTFPARVLPWPRAEIYAGRSAA